MLDFLLAKILDPSIVAEADGSLLESDSFPATQCDSDCSLHSSPCKRPMVKLQLRLLTKKRKTKPGAGGGSGSVAAAAKDVEIQSEDEENEVAITESSLQQLIYTASENACKSMEGRFADILRSQMETANQQWLSRAADLDAKWDKKFDEHCTTIQRQVDELTNLVNKAPSVVSTAAGTVSGAPSGSQVWAPAKIEVKGFVDEFTQLRVQGCGPDAVRQWCDLISGRLEVGIRQLIDFELSKRFAEAKTHHSKFHLFLCQPDAVNASIVKARIQATCKELSSSGNTAVLLNGKVPKIVVEPSPEEKPYRDAAGKCFSVLLKFYNVPREKFKPIWTMPFKIRSLESNTIVLTFDSSSGWVCNIEPFREMTGTADNAEQVIARLE